MTTRFGPGGQRRFRFGSDLARLGAKAVQIGFRFGSNLGPGGQRRFRFGSDLARLGTKAPRRRLLSSPPSRMFRFDRIFWGYLSSVVVYR